MKLDLTGKHVLITGGSTGIGLGLAKAAVKLGANISLVARTVSNLEKAKEELEKLKVQFKSPSKISFQNADVTDYDQVVKAVSEAEGQHGSVYLLVCCAGAANPGYFHEQDLSVFRNSMNLNFFGSVHAVKAIYPGMVARNQGHIVFITSVLAFMGMIGYSSYVPAKYAVRGFADCLKQELQGTAVGISIAYPLDTDTPGFQVENLTKPQETKILSEMGSRKAFNPDETGAFIMRSLLAGGYHLPTQDFGLNILLGAVKGVTSRSFPGVIWESFIGLFVPAITWFVASDFNKTCVRFASQRFAALRTSGKMTAGSSIDQDEAKAKLRET